MPFRNDDDNGANQGKTDCMEGRKKMKMKKKKSITNQWMLQNRMEESDSLSKSYIMASQLLDSHFHQKILLLSRFYSCFGCE